MLADMSDFIQEALADYFNGEIERRKRIIKNYILFTSLSPIEIFSYYFSYKSDLGSHRGNANFDSLLCYFLIDNEERFLPLLNYCSRIPEPDLDPLTKKLILDSKYSRVNPHLIIKALSFGNNTASSTIRYFERARSRDDTLTYKWYHEAAEELLLKK